jgi:hypothetical protein
MGGAEIWYPNPLSFSFIVETGIHLAGLGYKGIDFWSFWFP